jgi:cation diffusion facilitator CzcD-associated flavoprotein CzcO
VGGGFGGVGAITMLRRAGYEDVTVFERGERIGGVWHHNTYPGAACDVPSHLYSFSFEPKPDWRHVFSYQPEILDYLEGVTDKYGLPVAAVTVTRHPTDLKMSKFLVERVSRIDDDPVVGV